MSIASKLQDYATLEATKAQQEAALKATNIRMASLEQEIVALMSDQGLKKVTIDNPCRTYSLRRFVSGSPAEGVDRGDVGKALKACGYDALVREDYNTASLGSLIREYDKTYADNHGGLMPSPEELVDFLPEPLRGLIKVSERYGIASKKAA